MSTTIKQLMLTEIKTLPLQLSLGWRAAKRDVPSMNLPACQRVVICGMGGSAFPGDVVAAAVDEFGVEVSVIRDYRLPDFGSYDDCLIIVSSFSGGTEESLSLYNDAVHRGLEPIFVSGNSTLVDRIREHGQAAVVLPTLLDGFQPRSAYGLFVGAFLALIDTASFTPDGVLAEVVEVAGSWLSSNDSFEHTGVAIAQSIAGKIPLFCAPRPYGDAIARVAKIKINENAKRPAFWNELPEFNHNEMVGMTHGGSSFCVIVYDDNTLPARLRTRIASTVDALKGLGCTVIKESLEGPSRLARMMGALYRMDFATLQLAAETGVNPREVEMIERFKKGLAAERP